MALQKGHIHAKKTPPKKPHQQKDSKTKACYNCHRKRLRCDKSLPSCLKCSINGEECLGYGIVLRWAAYPLLNGLSSKEKWYMHHFATIVCRDLVSIDQKERNPFRAIIPLVRKFDYLQSVVLATAAMHLSTLHKYQGQSLPSESALVDALMLKSRALHLLRAAISDDTLTDKAMILSAIVFLVNLDLIDSGRGGWKAHVEAARRLISSLYLTRAHLDGAIAPLVNAIAADCLTYRIYGSTISGNTWSSENTIDDGVVLPYILQNAEAYSYHCAPPAILQIILSASQVCSGSSTTLETDGGVERIATAAALLHKARNFDVQTWVYSINGLPPDDDLEARVSVASAHRAAACLFVLLSVPEAGLLELPLLEPKDLVHEILGHLSCIPEDHVHLKGTVWPTFIVGAETDDLNERAWCLERLVAVWTKNPWTYPWGYVHTATEMLQEIWRSKDLAAQQGDDGINWLQRLKATGNSCLIV
ncbi:DNA-directed RNA polymerase I subunit RPA2 [Neurospora sp. IMI 360204]|nr:DNA-directed RNA polymerase I subunit RPA2 [Neurospora sp. IMI 360204]